MAVISFSREQIHAWVVAGWAFRQILQDVATSNPEDAEMVQELSVAEATKYLLVESHEPQLARRITSAIREVASGIVSGSIRSGIHDKPYGNALTVEQYHKSLRELLAAIPEVQA
ncbi:MAG: hypothetical protein ABR956_06410 [Terracidiphilus sp.]|jgi:hypothetical protein